MLASINFPLDVYSAEAVGGWDGLRRRLCRLGLDGVEGIWSGLEIPDDFPSDLLTGYHLTFFPEWLDFYRGEMEKVYAHFGNDENIRFIFGSTDPSILLETFRQDLSRALKHSPAYIVFHVSDVSMEENFTYRWLHSDEEVIDAGLEIINSLLENAEPTFDFLVENQMWPGFTFTDPALTKRLFDGIRYPRKGILLDTGHLMNTNLQLKNQKQGIEYIKEMLKRHGSLLEEIKGVHFHQSVSGRYTRSHIGAFPEDFPPVSDCLGQLNRTYSHILQIDRHRAWTEPSCVDILDIIRPKYLTHEMAGGGNERTFRLAARQIHTIQTGLSI